jgi:hypothetical protein
LKTDKQIKDISNRLNAISSSDDGNRSGNGNGNHAANNNNDEHDDYYLNMGRDPPRFLFYREAKS